MFHRVNLHRLTTCSRITRACHACHASTRAGVGGFISDSDDIGAASQPRTSPLLKLPKPVETVETLPRITDSAPLPPAASAVSWTAPDDVCCCCGWCAAVAPAALEAATRRKKPSCGCGVRSAGTGAGAGTGMLRRKLNLKAKLKSSYSYFCFKR